MDVGVKTEGGWDKLDGGGLSLGRTNVLGVGQRRKINKQRCVPLLSALVCGINIDRYFGGKAGGRAKMRRARRRFKSPARLSSRYRQPYWAGRSYHTLLLDRGVRTKKPPPIHIHHQQHNPPMIIAYHMIWWYTN